MRLATLAAALALAGCATQAPGSFDAVARDAQEDADARAAHAAAVVDWCEATGRCIDGMPPAGALPVYSESCGYLQPVLGDDC
jgi:hypothetical protein